MERKTARILIGTALCALVLSFQNCSKTGVSATAIDASSSGIDNGNPPGQTEPACTTGSVNSNKIVKILFIMDASGSNVTDTVSDKNKTWRLGTINNFLSHYSQKSNFYYGLTSFQGSSSSADIVNGTQGIFSNDMTVVQDGIDTFTNTKDSGSTPYKAALTLAKSIIKNDLAVNASQNAAYVVVMVSDGMATDYSNPSQVTTDVKSIMALAPDQISLNSVYYYNATANQSQTQYLQNIATAGNGVFINADSNQTLNIDDVISIPSNSCQ